MDIHFLSGSGIVAENSAGKSTPKSATDFPAIVTTVYLMPQSNTNKV